MFNYNAWFSVALEYGLSIFSIGKTGSSDEQLLTGGLTAVESLLGSEIGITKKEGFVVDHGNSHMERIPLIHEDENYYGQFLIQSLNDEKVEENYKELAKTFIIEFTTNLISSPYLDQIKISPQKLSVISLNSILIESYEITHRKIKVKTNNNFVSEIIKPVISSSFKNYSFSETLNNLSIMEDPLFHDYLQQNREILLTSYIVDIQNKIIEENPLIFLITQPTFFKNDLRSLILKELEEIRVQQTNKVILKVIEEIFQDNSLRPIIQKFNINTLRNNSDKINELIENLLRDRLIKNSPLIFLLTPNLDLTELIQENVIERFLTEFDLGNVLSRIAMELILKAHPEDVIQADLVRDFFINLSEIFPGGLPKQLWIIIVNLLQIYANEAKINLLYVNKVIKIEEIYWKTINENIKAYRVLNIANFNLAESGTELINLFDGVRESIGRSFHSFYTKFIWDFTRDSFGSYFNSLQLNIMTNYQAMQTVHYLINYLNYLKSKKLFYFDPINLGFNFQEFKKLVKPQVTSSRAIAIQTMSEMDLEKITQYFYKKLETKHDDLKFIEAEYEKILKQIPKIIEKAKIKSLKLKVDDKGNIKTFDLEKIKDMIIKDEEKQFKGDSFLTDSDFLFTYCTTLLFDSLTRDMINKAIDIAIYYPKTSKLIKTVIEKGKPIKRSEQDDFYFIENLKLEIISIGNTVLKQLISSTIHKEISREKFPLKTFISEKDEVLCVKIGELDKSFKKWIDDGVQLHPGIRIVLESKKPVVYLEVTRRPTTGINEVENLTDAIALQTYNNEMVRFGVFVESLKIVASTLGERERNKVQNLFTSIGEFLITD